MEPGAASMMIVLHHICPNRCLYFLDICMSCFHFAVFLNDLLEPGASFPKMSKPSGNMVFPKKGVGFFEKVNDLAMGQK